MAKSEKKTPKEASSLFHNIMKASVKGDKWAEAKTNTAKSQEILKQVLDGVEKEVPDWDKHSMIQVGMLPPHSISYFFYRNCPTDKRNKIEKTILEQTALIGISAEFHD